MPSPADFLEVYRSGLRDGRSMPGVPCGVPRDPGPSPVRFPLRLGRRSRALLLLWGVTPRRAYVDLDGALDARFGFFRLAVPVVEIERWSIEGPFRWITAIGVRRSIRHGDVTFAGDVHCGVRMDFRRPVRWGPFRVPALYLAVDDLEGFAAELEVRGIPGHDLRRARRR